EMLALLNIAGLLAGAMDDPGAADPYFRQAVEIGARAGLKSSYVYFNYGLNLSRLQRIDEALAALDEASSLAAKDGHQQGVRYRADSLRAEILIERGRLADARHLLETTLAAQKALPDAEGAVASLRRRSLLELREGRLDAALASARESLAETERGGFPEETLQSLAQVADVYAAQGRAAEAMDATAQRYGRQIDTLKRQNLDSLATLQADLQNAADERELQRLAFDNELKSLAIERARLLRNLAFAALAALAVLGSAFLAFQRRVNRRLRRLSMTDPLTGLTNRRIAARHLADFTHERDGRHVLLVVDADRFKTVNDSFGHVAGDQVLVELSRRLRACCRGEDLVARWGGEEFLIACRQSDHAHAQAFAERLRAAVAATPIVLTDGTKLSLTVSIGFAPIPFVPGSPERSWAQVVELADGALYVAKKAGRDAWAGVWGVGAGAAPIGASPADLVRAAAAGEVELSGSTTRVWHSASALREIERAEPAPAADLAHA
ncbi:MAG TPA: diguanylate cyclase, partial [Dokdonella sp.]